MKIEVYTDGSATVATKPGGYGYVIVVDGKKVTEGKGGMEKASNNDAELEAAIQGLAKVLKMRNEGAFPIEQHDFWLISDSQIILGWADGTYRFKQKSKKVKYEQLKFLVNKLSVQTRWVEGHSGDEHNEQCDKLANIARKEMIFQLGGAGLEVEKIEKVEKKSQSKIKSKKDGVFNLWYKGVLKVIDLDNNIVEDHDKDAHGPRTSRLEVQSK